MAENFLLGIDAGTTVVKSVIFDFKGKEIAKGSHSINIFHPKPGWAEQDMIEVWQAVGESIKEALSKASIKPDQIRGISISAQGAGSWFLGKDDKPVCNAVSWLDGRTVSIIERWIQDGTFEKLFTATGFIYYTGSGPGIIGRWFVENYPEVLENSKAIMWCSDWIRYCFTGELCTNESDASVAMVNPYTRRYSKEIFELTGLTEFEHLFPKIKLSYEIAGTVTKKAAEETGLCAGIPVVVGAWDCASTALGAGCINANDAISIIGTAGIHQCVIDKPLVNRAYSLPCHALPDKWLINSMAMTAANNLDWFEREFCFAERLEAEKNKVNKYDILNRIVEETPLGSNGVIFLPFLQGERAPFVEPKARGCFIGLGNWTKRGDLIKAVYEGVAFATLHNYEAMEKGTKFREVRIGGGGAQSEVWTQIIADCTGKVVKVPTGSEFGARGAAINAAVGLGIYKDYGEAVREMVQIEKIKLPNSKNTELYNKIFDLYMKLIESQKSIWFMLYDLLENKLKKM